MDLAHGIHLDTFDCYGNSTIECICGKKFTGNTARDGIFIRNQFNKHLGVNAAPVWIGTPTEEQRAEMDRIWEGSRK